MIRIWLIAALVSHGCGWWGNSTAPPPPDGPWRLWAKERVPTVVDAMDRATETVAGFQSSWTTYGDQGWDRGFWSVCDGIIGLVGWALFGSAWGNVRLGCKRFLQLCIVLGLCVMAHYVWAVCWPVVSLVIAILMTVIWVVRKGVRVAGGVMYYLQKLFGGTPEAVTADYYGPGTGSIPETADLRKFKFSASGDKWVVLRRGTDTVVFKDDKVNAGGASSDEGESRPGVDEVGGAWALLESPDGSGSMEVQIDPNSPQDDVSEPTDSDDPRYIGGSTDETDCLSFRFGLDRITEYGYQLHLETGNIITPGERAPGVGERLWWGFSAVDYYQVSVYGTHVVVFHHLPRTERFVPTERWCRVAGFTGGLEVFRDERLTVCRFRRHGHTEGRQLIDNWRDNGADTVRFPAFVGYTVLTFRTFPLTWEREEDAPDDDMQEDGDGEDWPHGEEEEVVTPSTEAGDSSGEARSRSPRRGAGLQRSVGGEDGGGVEESLDVSLEEQPAGPCRCGGDRGAADEQVRDDGEVGAWFSGNAGGHEGDGVCLDHRARSDAVCGGDRAKHGGMRGGVCQGGRALHGGPDEGACVCADGRAYSGAVAGGDTVCGDGRAPLWCGVSLHGGGDGICGHDRADGARDERCGGDRALGGGDGDGPAEDSGAGGEGGQGDVRVQPKLAVADNPTVEELAESYVALLGRLGSGTVNAWAEVLRQGDQLLSAAGSVEAAARALWSAREAAGLANLSGVNQPYVEEVLHPLMVDYLRSVEKEGMPARHPGAERRVEADLHPNAKKHIDQVYKQIWKDVRKNRVLVVHRKNKNLGATISSPFEAVDKMLPDRSVSVDKRVVHDQRGVNRDTHKDWHPPALQPSHEQIARRILWAKTRYPGVPVLLAKKDVAGAFRLLWVSPSDAALFAGDLPWRPESMESGEEELEGDQGGPMTIIYLVSSFGFCGSPGEWTVWGRATEEFHRAHRPGHARRDGQAGFDCKILVDDAVLVEPVIGLRPWTSADCYEKGVRMLLGEGAVNVEKDEIEGAFKEEQVIWGLTMNSRTERVSLPERRILRGAHLLSDPAFDAGSKTLTLRALQQFRGIMTGWAVVVRGLKNELKAADLFLTKGDGALPVLPRHQGYACEKRATDRAWEDLWDLFEVCRWLSARSDTWETKFCATLAELLEPRERLGLVGGSQQAVFVSADATTKVVGAIDWTNGNVARMTVNEFGPWLQEAVEEEADDEEVRIHLTELLAFVAMACTQGAQWSGKVVVYAGDNQVVKGWITRRQSGSRAGRMLVRVLAMCEMRYGFVVVAGWWRTFHNVDSDFVTRCTEDEFHEFVNKKCWKVVGLSDAVEVALRDSRRFGPCFLSWMEEEDRRIIMQLKEQRMARSIDRSLDIDWSQFKVIEWCADGRMVRDFDAVARACGASDAGPTVLLCGTLGCDVRGKQVAKLCRFIEKENPDGVVVEGPGLVQWAALEEWAEQHSWTFYNMEFVTTELGEALARKRRAYVLRQGEPLGEGAGDGLVRAVVATPLGAVVNADCGGESLTWKSPMRIELCAGIPRDPLLPHVVGHVWWESNRRENLHGLSGPGRWPLEKHGEFEELVVYDRSGSAGMVRVLSKNEVWLAQGRSQKEWEKAVQECGSEWKAYQEGCRATGVQTAENLLVCAAMMMKAGRERNAGAIKDGPRDESLAKLLLWLRRWKRGDYGPEGQSRRAGGGLREAVSRLGEALWLDVFEEHLGEMDGSRLAGGRRAKASTVAAESRLVGLQPGFDLPSALDWSGHATIEPSAETPVCLLTVEQLRPASGFKQVDTMADVAQAAALIRVDTGRGSSFHRLPSLAAIVLNLISLVVLLKFPTIITIVFATTCLGSLSRVYKRAQQETLDISTRVAQLALRLLSDTCALSQLEDPDTGVSKAKLKEQLCKVLQKVAPEHEVIAVGHLATLMSTGQTADARQAEAVQEHQTTC
eukprot:Skav213278  [mRNA]  locus=scaffold2944:132640:149231:+ [translate_table: standard]